MKRGEIWTVSGGQDYTRKPRPAVILQDDRFPETASIAICLLTGRPIDAPLFRLPIGPTSSNGLKKVSHVMVDKITTVPKTKLGERIGTLADEDIVRLNRAILVFLGLAGRQRGV